ncbi:MAG TPA: hypothetical protein VD996_08645, partial [Chitinophagaceae bacterium]|nr:hypothetical protein [Chitinophagaceae bacterium]
MQDGKRLSAIKFTNRNGLVLRQISFSASYQTSASGTTINNRNKRMFLESVSIRGGEISTVSAPLQYSFTYNDYGGLPSRLAYSQDYYGYYNGKTSNPSLIPALASGDVNYSHYNNGTGGALVTFGDRSIDTVYAKKGLLTRITYPTGGHDTLIYIANRFLPQGGTEKLA